MASEMLYPVMPMYLQSIGFSVLLIGILEGVAEATAGLSKGYFGRLSDSTGRRVPFVQAGYALSALSKPMMALLAHPLWVFLARTTDRLGKGLRTGARDALLSDQATPATKGKVFGFHRSMDTLGAVAGPSLALLYLWFRPADYRTLFFLAFAPGTLAILATRLLKENRNPPAGPALKTSFFSFLHYWKQSPATYRKLVGGLLAFALFNSSDAFLLLKARESGLSDTAVIGAYIFYNLIYALAAYPLGILADRIGLKRIFVGGLALFAIVYAGMAFQASGGMLFTLFFLYGLYAAATEGIAKAWISNISRRQDTATAIGTYAGLQSICLMLSSALTGLIWFHWGAAAAFMITAFAALLVAIYIVAITPAAQAQ